MVNNEDADIDVDTAIRCLCWPLDRGRTCTTFGPVKAKASVDGTSRTVVVSNKSSKTLTTATKDMLQFGWMEYLGRLALIGGMSAGIQRWKSRS